MPYLRLILGTSLFILLAAAALNYFVDPAGIYRNFGLNPRAYAEALLRSEHGLWIPEDAFDERLVSKYLALHSQGVDCVVIGSSRVMQISSVRLTKSLEDECTSILNLGVGGAAIEDHFVLSYVALQSGKPRKIILGIDPWTFAFGKDPLWTVYKNDYVQARARIIGETSESEERVINRAGLEKLVNLINLEYTLRSIRSATRKFRNVLPSISEAPMLDATTGGEYDVRLRDGSLVYSAKFISHHNQTPIPPGGTTYKTNGQLNNLQAIEAYRKLLLWIRRNGVEPIFLLTPYHENVWKVQDSKNVLALNATEPIAIKLANELSLKLVGSYKAKVVGCDAQEFFDFMHPTASCMRKLKVMK